MATLARYLPATRRQYSSFFSSKPGGGRYFNSAKAPKSVVPNGRSGANPPNSSSTPKNASQASAESNESLQDSANLSGGNGNASNRPNQLRSPKGDEAPTSVAQPTTSTNPLTIKLTLPPTQSSMYHPSHPVVSAKDFKLHQFFSLHRPLLLLSDPPAIFQSAPPTGPLFSRTTSGTISASDALNDPHSLLFTGQATSPDDTVDASIDADAEAARQLTRALTMSRAGATIDWETTLKTLGLDVSLEKDRVDLKEQMDREWEDVLMDSTQRKRRKKMKEHKLKKRRKATRATRLKIGR